MNLGDIKRINPDWRDYLSEVRMIEMIENEKPLDIYTLTKEELYDLYFGLCLPDSVLASIFNVKKQQVTKLRREHGVMKDVRRLDLIIKEIIKNGEL
jgi:hypothetical protein